MHNIFRKVVWQLNSNYNENINWNKALELTKDLIEIESYTNPGKENIINFVYDYIGNVEKEIVHAGQEDPYLIAKIGEDTEEPEFTLLLEGHLDTVPPGGMKDPFYPHMSGGKLYGRGSCDMKSGCAAMICSFMECVERSKHSKLKGAIYLILVTDEEFVSEKIVHALENKIPKGDLAIVAEPTDLYLGVAHKGSAWAEVTIHGNSSHASTPKEGTNAIYMASQFIQTVNDYTEKYFQYKTHAVGAPTLVIGTVEGGEYPNIVPNQCTIKMDKRYTPDETVNDFKMDIDTCIQICKEENPGFKADYKIIGKEWPPLDFLQESDLHLNLIDSLKKIPRFHAEISNLPYWGEGAFIQKYGTPSLYFGPGSIKNAHSSNEHVDIQSIITAFKGFTQIAIDNCFK